MFKIVKDFVTQPLFLMWCDASCANYIQGPKPTDAIADDQSLEAAFAQEALRQGWNLSLERHLCPMHAKAAAETRLIHVPSFAGFKN